MLTNVIVGGDIKQQLAWALKEKGLTQSQISRLLQITQPMVSKYLRSRPEISKSTQQLAEKVFKAQNLSISFLFATEQIPEGEYYLATKENIPTRARFAAIAELKDAIELLRKKDLSFFIPKVKVNIAYALEGAESKQDIASIPSGLVFVKNRLSHYAEPEFGTSSHLSSLLLNLKKRCVMNIKYSPLRLKDVRHAFMEDDYSIDEDADVLIHKGSFGIEPAAYVFGESPEEVIRKVLSI